ncbi:beta-lactamase family protein [Paenibacillus thiaminolyticus]|uniref:serine hydrolase domain-containing protein n=1 Tax=Paenibacillus thiaminolyticus TaxID=49283 RepID=UPI00234FBA23|nr:serine hydrolase domain-containing protein [Paenibacillus thiaminolyticus]WCR28355.1 beta-lactamase family protein [Paenibacillus thiaminolyticus]
MRRNGLRLKVIACLLVFGLLAGLLGSGVYAEEAGRGSKSLEAVMDEYILKGMETNHVAGASLVVVKDGKVVLKKGYGYADTAGQVKVNPDQTLFRIGSVTKLFTATAAMQLVEQGKLELDKDINTYLKGVKINNPYDTPLTLRHLLTQTGGFAESSKGIYSDKLLEQPVPLSETIARHMPPLIRRPGEVIQYSNYGYALIGHLIEQVSGESYGDYLRKHLFTSLGMTSASYTLDPSLLPKLSKGYAYEGEGFTESPPGSILVYPAGAIVSTPGDVSKFLLAHLQDGAFNGGRILKEETARNMRNLQFTAVAGMPGYGFGFYQNSKNHAILMHDGDADPYTSQFSIYPEGRLGFFFTYNTSDDGALRDGVEEKLYQFFGLDIGSKVRPAGGAAVSETKALDPKVFEGKYVFAQRELQGPLRARGLFLKMGVATDEQGHVKLSTFDSNMSGTYVKSADGTYVKPTTGRRLALKEDPDGQQYLLVNMKTPLQTMVKLSGKEVLMENLVRPIVFGIALLGCLVGFIRLLSRKKRKKLEGAALWAKRFSYLLCLLILLLGVEILAVMFTQSDAFRETLLKGGYVISGLIVLGTIGLLLTQPRLWGSRTVSLWLRGFSILVMIASAGSLVYAIFLDLY